MTEAFMEKLEELEVRVSTLERKDVPISKTFKVGDIVKVINNFDNPYVDYKNLLGLNGVIKSIYPESSDPHCRVYFESVNDSCFIGNYNLGLINSNEVELSKDVIKEETIDIPENIQLFDSFTTDNVGVIYSNREKMLILNDNNEHKIRDCSGLLWCNCSEDFCLVPVDFEDLKAGDVFTNEGFEQDRFQWNIIDKNEDVHFVWDNGKLGKYKLEDYNTCKDFLKVVRRE